MATVTQRISHKTSQITYQVKIRIKGLPPVTETFKGKKAADKWAKLTEAKMIEGKYFPHAQAKKHTLSELIDAYLNTLKAAKARRLKDVKPKLEWWKAQLGYVVLADLTTEQIITAQNKLFKKPSGRVDKEGESKCLSVSTVNRYTVALHTVLVFGIRKLKWVQENPVSDGLKYAEPSGRVRYLTIPEIEQLLDVCRQSKNPYLFAIVLIGVSTGARRGEIGRMKWSDVDENAGLIIMGKTKNGSIRAAQLTGPALAVVKSMRLKRKPEDVYLFPSPTDPSKSVDFYSAWENAIKLTGIADFHFHDLRHTCASHLAMNGANEIEIADVLGHKDLQMVRRYSHLCPKHLSTVVGKMTEKVLGHVKT